MRGVLIALSLLLMAASPATAKYNGPHIDIATYTGLFCGYTAQYHLDQPDAARPSEACATGCRPSRKPPGLWEKSGRRSSEEPPPALPKPRHG